jgi:hypothetical protein
MTAADLASRLEGVQRRGSQFSARCPAHEDTNPSLSFADGDKGLVLKCHAGCEIEAVLKPLDLRPADLFQQASPALAARRRLVATYPYRDETGALLFEVLRYEPGKDGRTKDFSQRRPDGGGGWIYDTKSVRRVLYRLPELAGQDGVYLAEGEKDVDALWAQGVPATTGSGGADQWRDDYASQLRAVGVETVIIIPDNDRAGMVYAAAAERSCRGIGLTAVIVQLPGLRPLQAKHGEDVSDWLAAGHTVTELEAIATAAVTSAASPVNGSAAPTVRSTPWTRAVSVTDFLAQEDHEVAWLEEHVLAPGSLTEIFAPRGLGKSHVLHGILIKLARRGTRCLLLDRDNSRREVKRRLRAWDPADLPTLRVMLRDDVPPLTDTKAWAQFPFTEYDVVAIDSLDATAEGVGEQDSAKPARAIAPILDLCHRADGPAVVVLGNVIKSGAHSRGSGVVEDRADIAYEVRDATGFTPSGTKDWWLELPPAGVDQWASRATRRKRRDTYRLAFVSSKFRIGEEPDPFVYELNLGTEPWTFRLCTEDIVAAGHEARATATQERTARLEAAALALRGLLAVPMASAAAEQYLKTEHRLRRAEARALLAAKDGVLWAAQVDPTKPGRPKLYRALAVASEGGFQEASAAGMPPRESPVSTASGEAGIFADRVDTPRRDSPSPQPRINGGDSDGGVSAAEPGLKGAPGPGEERL